MVDILDNLKYFEIDIILTDTMNTIIIINTKARLKIYINNIIHKVGSLFLMLVTKLQKGQLMFSHPH